MYAASRIGAADRTGQLAEWKEDFSDKLPYLINVTVAFMTGTELVSGWIPNRIYPSLSITTLFHGNEFKNTSYNLSQNLLDKYDSGAMTLHELVN